MKCLNKYFIVYVISYLFDINIDLFITTIASTIKQQNILHHRDQQK